MRVCVCGGGGGGGEKVWVTCPRNPTLKRPKRPWTTARTTTMLRQWRPRHCEATSVLCSCCFNCCVEQSHKDNVRSTAVEKQRKQKTSPTFWAQLHLPALDLFWALLRAQHHVSPPDVAWTRIWLSNFFLRVQLTSLLLISPGPAYDSLTSSWESSSPPFSWSRLDPQTTV